MSDLGFLGFELVLNLEKEEEEEDMDLGRRFRTDEAEMVPKNRLSMLLLLLLSLLLRSFLMASELLAVHRERESLNSKWKKLPTVEREEEREANFTIDE